MNKINSKLLIGLMTAALLSGSIPVMADPAADEIAVTESSELTDGSTNEQDNTEIVNENPDEAQELSTENSEADTETASDEENSVSSGEDTDQEGQTSSEEGSEEIASEGEKTDGEKSDKEDTDPTDEKTEEEESDSTETADKDEEKDSDTEESEETDKKDKTDKTEKDTDKEKTTEADEAAKKKEEEAEAAHEQSVPYTGIVNVPLVPRWVFNYSVKHYTKIAPVYKTCKVEEAYIREVPDSSSADSIVAKLSKGAYVRLIDDSNSSWWFIETRDQNGRIVRGYAERVCFRKAGIKCKEDPEKVQTLKETNNGFDAVEKTTYDELSLGENVWETREDLVNYALQSLGDQYTEGEDNSAEVLSFAGFAERVYAELGIDLPQSLEEQFNTGTKTKMKDAQPGDLIFYDSAKGIEQVVICLSNDGKGHIQVIQPSPEDGRIVVSNLNRDYLCRVRTYDQLNADRSDPESETIDLSEWTPVGECRLTSYCYDCNTPAHSAITASGIPATEWHTVAVDSSVIPLGSRVYIEGYGLFVAEDTGVKGNWCDLYVHNIQCDIWDVAQVYYM